MNSINKKSCLTSTSHAVDRSTINFDKNELIQISNHQFITELFRGIPENAYAAVCTKPGNPEDGGWKARPISQTNRSLSPDENTYINCSSFYKSENGSFSVKIISFAALHFLVLDDIGTKIPMERFDGFEPSWLIETSPDNFQMGVILNKPITDKALADALIKALIGAGFSDPGASGVSRWARLPNGINGKAKYRDKLGNPFRCKLTQWNPEKHYAAQEIIDSLKLNIAVEPVPETKSIVVEIDTNANAPIKETHSAQSSESDREKLAKLKKLLEHIGPDIGYQEWLKVLIAIFNETGGSDEGLTLAIKWSSEGKKFKDPAEIRGKWESFNPDHEYPITIATLYKKVRDSGRGLKINPEADDSFRKCNDTESMQTLGPFKGANIHAERDVASQSVLDSAQRLDPLSYPDKPKNENGRVPATIPNVKYLLNSYGITVRYNTIRKKLMVSIPGFSGIPDNADNVSITHIISLATLNNMQYGQIPAYVEAIADQNPYNPVAEWIQSKSWDGKDRHQEFCNTLIHRPDFSKELKETLLRKWLLSAVAAVLKPSGFKARGVLTLQGPQSIGKTAWVSNLVPDISLRENTILIDHHLDAGNKDSILTAVSHWIVEIGELDSSFKKDISRLKGFLTKDYDKVRRPYSRASSEYPRRTVFCATVNDHNFLVDSTGNTRWWTIPVESVNYRHNIDMQQLFAQLANDFKRNEQWWLTPEEEKLLEEHNVEHRAISVVREKILNYIDPGRKNEPSLPAMTAMEVLITIGIDRPSNIQCKECAAVLRELLGDSKRIKGKNKWRIPIQQCN